MLHVTLVAAEVIGACMIALWLASLALRDASIVDLFWGTGFVVVALLARAVGDGAQARRDLLALLCAVWGARLTLYLAWRNLGKGEDYRYASMRRRLGARFPLVSLPLVFGL